MSVVEDKLFDNVSVHSNTYESEDGLVIIQLRSVHNTGHETVPVEAALARDFVSKFNRREGGEIIIADASTDGSQTGAPVLTIILLVGLRSWWWESCSVVLRRNRRSAPT